MLKFDNSIDLYEEFNRLIEDNKLDTKYAEIINVIIYIIMFTVFFITNKFTSTINCLIIICVFYMVSKMLNFMMFGSRSKRRKQKLLIKESLNNLKKSI